LTRLGKIRLGIKVANQSGAEYPRAVDYFVLPDELKAQFGDKPKELPIMFLSDDEPEQWYKAYSKSRGLVCRGDGERAMALVDMATGDIASRDSKTTELRDVPCCTATCPIYQKKQCKGIMNLQFYVRGTEMLGVYQLDTSSVNSIININSSLAMLRSISGRQSMVPVTLVVEPREVQPEGKKKTVWVLQLHINMAEAQDAAQRRLGAPVVHALPSPETDEAPDDMYTDDGVADDPSFKPEPRPEPKPRHRRTNAEIKADAALAAEPVESPVSAETPPEGEIMPTEADIEPGDLPVMDEDKGDDNPSDLPFEPDEMEDSGELITPDQASLVGIWYLTEKLDINEVARENGWKLKDIGSLTQVQFEVMKEARRAYIKGLSVEFGWGRKDDELDRPLTVDQHGQAKAKRTKNLKNA